MPKYIVVDDLNQWLTSGEFADPQAAFKEALLTLESSEFERPSEITVFEVIDEVDFEVR